MDKLVINDIKFYTIIGIHPWEQSVKQQISLDLELDVDAKKAAELDNIDTTLDYDKLITHLLGYIDNHQFHLIETLAEHVANEILTHFPTPKVVLKLHKPGALKAAKDVYIQLERHK